MAKSAIEWTESAWNPVTGCTKVSPGCKNPSLPMTVRQSGSGSLL